MVLGISVKDEEVFTELGKRLGDGCVSPDRCGQHSVYPGHWLLVRRNHEMVKVRCVRAKFS